MNYFSAWLTNVPFAIPFFSKSHKIRFVNERGRYWLVCMPRNWIVVENNNILQQPRLYQITNMIASIRKPLIWMSRDVHGTCWRAINACNDCKWPVNDNGAWPSWCAKNKPNSVVSLRERWCKVIRRRTRNCGIIKDIMTLLALFFRLWVDRVWLDHGNSIHPCCLCHPPPRPVWI